MSQASRGKILAAAVDAFGTKGFHGTTTRDIATAAGMSPAGIYVHHRSKEDLLFVISREGHRTLLEAVSAAASQPGDAASRLAAVVRAWVATNAENHAVARVVKDEIDVLSPEHREEIVTLRRRTEGVVRELVDEGVSAGLFSANSPTLTARAVISLGMDVARWYRPDGTWTVEQIADHFADLALRLVRP